MLSAVHNIKKSERKENLREKKKLLPIANSSVDGAVVPSCQTEVVRVAELTRWV